MKKYPQILSLIFVLAIFVQSLNAQKVGVVLSGGGPRGVAHVGVLKALEENEIPIDYIVGTSMGAIVGGLYASGYSPDEILQMITSDEMRSWISGSINNQDHFLFKETPPNASWQMFKITYDTVLRAKLPTNLVSPREMDFGFLRIFSGASAAAGYNFDNLLIPFRCVASDIVESHEVTFKTGQLEKAVRASMTFPFYFKPIKVNNRLMFDGGMYNNFPVDVLIAEFNPEVIIGSKAASNFGPPADDNIISLIQSMLMANTRYTVDTASGILIEPQLWSVNVTDFSNTQQFIDSGYVSTIRKIPEIKKFINRTITQEEIKAKREAFRSKIPAIKINDIIVKGVNDRQKQYLQRLVRKRKLVKKLDGFSLTDNDKLDLLKRSFYQILAENQVENVYPEMIYLADKDAYDMIYNIDKSNMLEMQVGGLVSSRAINEIFFQMNYNRWGKTALNLIGNAYLGRFHNSGHVGARLDVPISMPLAFELSYTLNGWNYFRTGTYFFEDDKPSFLIQQDNFWSFEISTPLILSAKFTLQIQAGRKKDEYYQTNQFSRLDTTDVTFFDFYSPSAIFELNTLNRKQFASQGMAIRLCGRFISGLEKNIPGSTSVNRNEYSNYHNWLQLRFAINKYFDPFGSIKFGIYGEASLSNKELFNNYTSTVLGAPAFEPIPESQTIFLPQFRANNFAGGGVKFILPVIKNMDFRAEGYIFQPFREILKTEDNKAELGPAFSNRYFTFSGRLVYHAPFGPISTSLNYYDAADEPYVFNINIGYYLFNKRPFH
ncbi:MAG: patatin-like phospholipase family protein [Bacteroidetes bacterium]|nr:patatin-like phospholipase family protein [Bacteroidota bacterium]